MHNKTVIDMTIPTPHKHTVRFDCPDDGMAVQNVYVSRIWLLENDSPNGVRVTLEPIE